MTAALAALRAALAEATPRPWRKGGGSWIVSDDPAATTAILGSGERRFYGGCLICESLDDPNIRVIVYAVNLAPALLAVADAAREHVAAHYARTQAGPRGAGVAEAQSRMIRADAELRDALAALDKVAP